MIGVLKRVRSARGHSLATYLNGVRNGLYSYKEYDYEKSRCFTSYVLECNYINGKRDGVELCYVLNEAGNASMIYHKAYKNGVLHGISIDYEHCFPSLVELFENGTSKSVKFNESRRKE
jgi:antitoxin component YwqK of YwqJK toxin-antitoxin module